MAGPASIELLADLGHRIKEGAEPSDPAIGELFARIRDSEPAPKQLQKLDPPAAIIEYALDSCDQRPEAIALLARCTYELAFRLSDEAPRPTDDMRGEVVLRPTGRVLRALGEQFIVWAEQFETMRGRGLPGMRKRIGELAEREAHAFALKLPDLLELV